MATRAPKICTCGRKVEANARCECERERQRARPTSSQRGYGPKWRAARTEWLARPENAMCATPGCSERANTIAHTVAHKGDQKLFWDRKNWQPSCARHNASQCASIEGGFGNPVGGRSGISCDAAGRPGVSPARDNLKSSNFGEARR